MTLFYYCNKIETNKPQLVWGRGGKMLRRSLIILTVIILAVSLVSAVIADSMPMGFAVGISWIDDNGNINTQYANEISYAGYENSYWLLVPPEAMNRVLVLQIEDTTGFYGSFMPSNGTELFNYIDAGADLRSASYTEINCYDQNNAFIGVVRLYLSTTTEYPEQPGSMIATIGVRCLNAETGAELNYQLFQCESNQYTTIPAPEIQGYTIYGESWQEVYVDMNGTADRNSVEFWYIPATTPEAPVVTVRYIDQMTYSEIRQAEGYTCALNDTTMIQAPEIPGYTLNSDSAVYVSVDGMGNPNPTEAAFYYVPLQAPTVMVRYIDIASNTEIRQAEGYTCALNDTTMIQAPEIPGYTLNSDSVVYVSVDGMGNPNPTEAAFYYMPLQAPTVTVRYIDIASNTEIRQAEGYTCALNDTTMIQAPEIPGYTLNGDGAVYVIVDGIGNASPSEVVFYYAAIPDASVTVSYLDRESAVSLFEDEIVVCPIGLPTTIQAKEAPGYRLVSDSAVTIYVDNQGNASVLNVVFEYMPILNPSVIVRYIDAQTNIDIETSISTECPLGQETVIQAKQIPGYSIIEPSQYVVAVNEKGDASVNELSFYYQPVQPPIITVRYVDSFSGQDITAPAAVTCPLNETTIVKAIEIAGYQLLDEGQHVIEVNSDGRPDSETVIFTYQKITDPVINIRFLDFETRSDIAAMESQACPLGKTTTVFAHGIEGYVIVSETSCDVTVDMYGNTSVPEVVFLFEQVDAPTVNVQYCDERGSLIAESDTQTCALNAETVIHSRNIPGYELLSEPNVTVRVDAYGNPAPGMVSFIYRPIPAPEITVYYFEMKTSAEIMSSAQVTCPLNGSVTVEAERIAGYTIVGNASQVVAVDEYGVPNPSQIVFYYQKIDAPVITVRYQDITTLQDILPPESTAVALGSSTVFEAKDIPGYQKNEPLSAEVYVDDNGVPSQDQVCFLYSAIQAPVVVVRYIDELGLSVAPNETVTVPLGETISLSAKNIAGYRVISEESITVVCNMTGAINPGEAVFRYQAIPDPVITISYLENGTDRELYSRETRTISLNTTVEIIARGISGYVVTGSEKTVVTADALGNAVPESVVFRYEAIDAPMVTVSYVETGTGRQLAQPGSQTCPLNEETKVYPVHIDGYLSLSDSKTVSVDSDGHPYPAHIEFEYRRIEEPAIAVRHIRSGDLSEIAQAEEYVCKIGKTTNIPAKEIPGYKVIGDNYVPVAVDAQGTPEMAEVVFVYEPVEEPMVLVKCLGKDGKEVLVSKYITCAIGQRTIIEAPAVEGYTLTGDSQKAVTVDASGKATPGEIEFTYVPDLVIVRIVYKDQSNNTEFFSTSQTFRINTENTVSVDMSTVPDVFELADDAEKTVIINADGTPDPSEVVFYFRAVVNTVVNVSVHYLDKATNIMVASDSFQECYEGTNIVKAAPIDLKPGYIPEGSDIQNVIIRSDGSAEPGEVIFYYLMQMTAVPVPDIPDGTQFPYDVEYTDIYAFPNTSSINFRSSPSTTGKGNVLGTISKNDIIHLVGRVTLENGDTWYLAEIEGITGFVSGKYVRPAGQDEINRAFGYTASPAPTGIPDGYPIEKWAATTKAKVNVRSEASKKSRLVVQAERKNTQLWVYDSLTVDNEKWYHIKLDGKDGYVLAELVELKTDEESLRIQMSLATAVPTHTPDSTRMATSVVTPSPTPYWTYVPTDIPTPDPTPEPERYTGYAITSRDTTLYYTADFAQRLAVVPEDTLVLIKAQIYIDGWCWDSIDFMNSGESGFMIDDDLKHISNDDAKAFADRLHATNTPTVIPTAVPAQQTGFAATLGDNVVIRSFPGTNAQIIQVLPRNTVLLIHGQEYEQDDIWDLVNIDGDWGYIRHDLLRLLTQDEIFAYLDTLKTPTPLPVPTPTVVPVTGYNLSSYGYVDGDKVNLRAEPKQRSGSLKIMERFAFALVLGYEEMDGRIWYRISQAGTEGYIREDLFHVLTLDELPVFLGSEDYRNSNSNTVTNTSSVMTSYEDYTVKTWENPALNVSYEPFSVSTPAPSAAPEATETAQPTETAEPLSTAGIGGLITDITPTPEPDSTINGEKAKSSFNVLGVVLAIGAVAVGGGGIYTYIAYQQNQKRKREIMASQARAAARRDRTPQTRPAANNPAQQTRTAGQSGAMNKAPFMPPAGTPGTVSARNASSQGTVRYPMDSAQDAKQGTTVYKTSTQSSVESDTIWKRKSPTAVNPPLQHPVTAATASPHRPETHTESDSDQSPAPAPQTAQPRHRRSTKYRNSDDTSKK